MKIVIRHEGQDWRENFAAVVEIDDRVGKPFKLDFLQKHIVGAIGVALCDLKHPVVAVLMHKVNGGVLALKDEIAKGLLLSLECHEFMNGRKKARAKTG